MALRILGPELCCTGCYKTCIPVSLCISSPGLDEVEDDTTDGILAVRLIIGLDFDVTRSSPDSC